jgi:beta-lactamase regulating signal transducer with metallopeptidase domain
MSDLWTIVDGRYIFNVPRILFSLTHQIAWRFLASAIMITPFVLLIIAVRGKLSASLRSRLLGACFVGLLLPFQRSAFYLFDSLFPFVRKASMALVFPENGIGPYNVFELVSAIWLVGFLAFLVVRGLEYRKTIRMLRQGRLDACSTYFYRFRSHIYLPPHFKHTYTELEQEMLMAHERQHVKQHDPFLYRLLAILECACWFNPLIAVAVRHFQHERELLCDERVTRVYSKYEYGTLLVKVVKEKKTTVPAATAGIIMEFGSVYERLSAIISPMKVAHKWAAAALVCIAVLQFSFGFIGFRPAWMSLSDFSAEAVASLELVDIGVSEIASLDANNIEYVKNFDKTASGFVRLTKDSLSIDQDGLYEYALSQGLSDKSCILISYVDSVRPAWGAGNISASHIGFEVGSLKTEELSLELTRNTDIYSVLTDIFI